MDWLAALQQLRSEGTPSVLVTVVETRGHAPRNPGAKLVVGAEHTWGSVGGGNLEATAIDRARAMITAGDREPETLTSRLNEHTRHVHGQQCCGGEVTLLLEPFPVRPTVAIFGVGHVGYELARILSRLEISLHLVDSRAEQLDQLRLAEVTGGSADVHVHRALLGEVVLDQLPAGAHVVIMTHDHAEDFALCDAAIRRPQLGSVGLIGSAAKWSKFRANLRAAGHDDNAIAQVISPIGRPELPGKDPAVIAVGVAAELIAAMAAAPAPVRP